MDTREFEWDPNDLLSIAEVTAWLKRKGKPRHPQSLYDRIRRGTLYGVKIHGRWYIPRPYVEQLAREPYRRRGGRPRLYDTSLPLATRHRIDRPDYAEVERLARLPVSRRLRLALEIQTLQLNLIRARLAQQYPRLDRRALNLKLIEELQHG